MARKSSFARFGSGYLHSQGPGDEGSESHKPHEHGEEGAGPGRPSRIPLVVLVLVCIGLAEIGQPQLCGTVFRCLDHRQQPVGLDLILGNQSLHQQIIGTKGLRPDAATTMKSLRHRIQPLADLGHGPGRGFGQMLKAICKLTVHTHVQHATSRAIGHELRQRSAGVYCSIRHG